MRMILATLIVFMHAFTCYNHSWREPAGFIEIPLYKWLCRISFAFTLEAFVLISGYLFAFQRITLGKKNSSITLVASKFKRLILPSIIFSILYFVLFYQYDSFANFVYSIINGCGHMWFLPMLFWCFIIGWILEQIKIKDSYKMVLLSLLNLFMVISLPLRLSNAISFLVYFYGGLVFYRHSERIKKAITSKRIILSWLLFIAVFVILRPLRDEIITNGSMSKYQKIARYVGDNACQFIYVWSGLVAFYGTSIYYSQRYQLTKMTQKISYCCFGIYLIQQFVLQLLYYKTAFPILVGPYWLPWIGFIIASIISFVLSDLLLRTKAGKFLIG